MWCSIADGSQSRDGISYEDMASPDTPDDRDSIEFYLATLSLNGESVRGVVEVALIGELIYIRREDAAERLAANLNRQPAMYTSIWIQDSEYLPLRSMGFESVQFDRSQLALNLVARPEMLEQQRAQVQRGPKRGPTADACCSYARLDYSAAATRAPGVIVASGSVRGIVSFAPNVPGFGSFGLVSMFRDRSGISRLDLRAERTDVYWQIDELAGRNQLRLGDTGSSQSVGLPQRRFFGVSLGTNINLTNQTQTFTDYTVNVDSLTAAELQLIVDGRTVDTFDMRPGQLRVDLDELPRSSGTVEWLLRGADGNLISRSSERFFRTSGLLETGRTDYSIGIGALRQQPFGLERSYDGVLATGSIRYGLSPSLTFGTGLDYANEVLDIGTSAILASRIGNFSAQGNLRLSDVLGWKVGASYVQRLNRWSLSGTLELGELQPFADTGPGGDKEEFRSIRVGLSGPLLNRQGNFRIDYLNEKNLALSSSDFLAQVFPTREQIRIRAEYRFSAGPRLTINAFSSMQSDGDSGFGLTLRVPIGQRKLLESRYQRRRFGSQSRDVFSTRYSQTNPEAIIAEQSLEVTSDQGGFANALIRNDAIQSRIDVGVNSRGELTASGSVGGAIFVVDSNLVWTRDPGDAFTIIRNSVESLSFERVQPRHVHPLGKDVLITGLQPYQINTLSLDSSNLPIGYSISGRQWEVTPPRNQIVSHPIQIEQRVERLCRLEIEMQSPAPQPGSPVLDESGERVGFVGLNGLVSVVGADADEPLNVMIGERVMKFSMQDGGASSDVSAISSCRIGAAANTGKPNAQ